MKEIKIRVWGRIERKRFDVELSHDGTSVLIENKTRGDIHDLVRVALNQAFEEAGS